MLIQFNCLSEQYSRVFCLCKIIIMNREIFHHRQSKACILSVTELVFLPKICAYLDFFFVQKRVYLSSKQCPIRKI